MNMRKITSLTALLSFVVLVINSVILYIMPEGRVAYWSDWHMWGLSKSEWGDQHIIVGVLFLAAVLLHIYYNWKPILSYLRNKARQLKFFNSEFHTALVITVVCIVGAYFSVPPFNWVVNWSQSIKNAAGIKYGEPPYGHAELSTIKILARRNGFDLEKSLENLRQAGIRVENENQTLLAVSQANRKTPQKVYLVMNPVEETQSADGKRPMPTSPIAGTGKRTVDEICRLYGLDVKKIMTGFAANRIKATSDMNLRAIGEQNGLAPDDVYDLMRKIAEAGGAAASQTAVGADKDRSADRQETPTGLGRLTVAQICLKYDLNQTAALEKLSARGIAAAPDDPLKKLAEKHALTPMDLYEIIK